MCLTCHVDKDAFHKNVHARAWPKEKSIDFEHSCETCHGPGSLHAAAGGDKNNPDFWRIRNPSKDKANIVNAACMECHTGGKRMHWLGSVHEAKNVSCLACHSMHNDQANEGTSPILAKTSEAQVH
jgi:hypothetical protein